VQEEMSPEGEVERRGRARSCKAPGTNFPQALPPQEVAHKAPLRRRPSGAHPWCGTRGAASSEPGQVGLSIRTHLSILTRFPIRGVPLASRWKETPRSSWTGCKHCTEMESSQEERLRQPLTSTLTWGGLAGHCNKSHLRRPCPPVTRMTYLKTLGALRNPPLRKKAGHGGRWCLNALSTLTVEKASVT